MTGKTGEFGMSNTGIRKNYKLHRYQNVIRNPKIKAQFICHGDGVCGRIGYVKIYCPQFGFLLESKLTFLSNKYARRFSCEQMWPVIAAMIVCLQETIRFATLI
jgi:hypothetical protein